MLAATLLALGSAVIHASWNLLIKTSGDRALAAWGQFLAAALLAIPAVAIVGPPGWEVAPYLAATGLVHIVYIESLVAAFTHGDFSLSYPLARGGGAVLAAVGSVVFLGDRLPVPAWMAIAVAGVGLISLRGGRGVPAAADVVLGDVGEPRTGTTDARPASTAASSPATARRRAGERAALGFALLTAVCIASYTLVDSAGSRVSTDGVAYALCSVATSGVAITALNLAQPRRRRRAALLVSQWRRNVAGGLGTTVAYTMVLVAVREAPVGYVTMLRESSVVIGALIGWLVLKEGLGARRLVSSAVVLAGLVLLVAFGR